MVVSRKGAGGTVFYRDHQSLHMTEDFLGYY
jgi:hypothetical protein